MTRYYRLFMHLTVVLGLSMLLAGGALAQQTTGDITGRVTDALGNIVPNASVSAHNIGTGLTRTATTDAAGEFTLTQLPAGKYDVTVEGARFSKTPLQEVELNVGGTQSPQIERQ